MQLTTHYVLLTTQQVGASAQLLGAFCFNVSCVYGLPHMATTHLQARRYPYNPKP